MKCPKCGYLGFEAVDRCRNCGYDFSLTPLVLPELPIRETEPESNPVEDLSLIDAAASSSPAARVPPSFSPDLERVLSAPRPRAADSGLSLFSVGGEDAADDAPLISAARPPRAPLAVRRATPEIPRLRSTTARAPMLDLTPSEPEPAISASVTPGARGRAEEWIVPDEGPQPANYGARFLAVVIDLVILAVIDAVVVYFTMQICGLELADITVLPKGPLLAFLLVQNGGYLVVFTAGGQTLGKMATGIRVVSARSSVPLDLGHAIVRTLVWTALVAPAGLGLLTAFLNTDRRGLHDHLAGTKVVRAA